MERELPGGYPPAKGLLKLTWTQVQMFDRIISQLCQMSAEGAEIELVVVIRNGQPRRLRHPVIEGPFSPV
jgi:hypothetical protein